MSDSGSIIRSAAMGDAILTAEPDAGAFPFNLTHVVLRDLNFRSYDNPNIDATAIIGRDHRNAISGAETAFTVVAPISAIAGEYFQVAVYQDSGGALDLVRTPS